MSKKQNKEPKLSEAFDELEKIVNEFEEGDVDLEKSIEKFKKGIELSKYLKKRLNEIENEIVEIKGEFEDSDKQDHRSADDKSANENNDSQDTELF